MSDPSRQQFAWPSPGEPRDEASAKAFYPPVSWRLSCSCGPPSAPPALPHPPPPPPSRPQAPSGSQPAVATFCLVCLAPERVDHLRLQDNLRYLYRSSPAPGGGVQWTKHSVNP
jgi:hypothetical protein